VQRLAGSLGTALLAVVLQRAMHTQLTAFDGGIGEAAALARRDPAHAAPAIAHSIGAAFWIALTLTAVGVLPALFSRRRETRLGDACILRRRLERAADCLDQLFL
jgi:ABC-type Fe3+ transport system permease subunit